MLVLVPLRLTYVLLCSVSFFHIVFIEFHYSVDDCILVSLLSKAATIKIDWLDLFDQIENEKTQNHDLIWAF